MLGHGAQLVAGDEALGLKLVAGAAELELGDGLLVAQRGGLEAAADVELAEPGAGNGEGGGGGPGEPDGGAEQNDIGLLAPGGGGVEALEQAGTQLGRRGGVGGGEGELGGRLAEFAHELGERGVAGELLLEGGEFGTLEQAEGVEGGEFLERFVNHGGLPGYRGAGAGRGGCGPSRYRGVRGAFRRSPAA